MTVKEDQEKEVIDGPTKIAQDFQAKQEEARKKEAEKAAEGDQKKDEEESKGASEDEKSKEQKTEGEKEQGDDTEKDDETILATDDKDLSEDQLKRKEELVKSKDKSITDKVEKRKGELQQEIDQLVSQKKALEAEGKDLKAANDRINALEEQVKQLAAPKVQEKIKQTAEERINQYIEEDASLPREQRREMSRDDLEEWLNDDMVSAQEWIAERALRRREENKSLADKEARDNAAQEFFKEQDKSRKKLYARFPEIIPNQQRLTVLQQQGLSDDEIKTVLMKENEYYRLCVEIAESDPKYVTEINGPELVMAEMEKRLKDKKPKTVTLTEEELEKIKQEAMDVEKNRRERIDESPGGDGKQVRTPGNDPVYEKQLAIAAKAGYSKAQLDDALERRKKIPGANVR